MCKCRIFVANMSKYALYASTEGYLARQPLLTMMTPDDFRMTMTIDYDCNPKVSDTRELHMLQLHFSCMVEIFILQDRTISLEK